MSFSLVVPTYAPLPDELIIITDVPIRQRKSGSLPTGSTWWTSSTASQQGLVRIAAVICLWG